MRLLASCTLFIGCALNVSAQPALDYTQVFPDLLAKHGGPTVLVDYVLSMDDAAGGSQRVQGSIDGVLISADGLVLVPASILDPKALFRQILPESQAQGLPGNMRSSEFKVRRAGQGEPMRADVLTQDKDLGIAWLKIKNPQSDLPFVDFSKLREPRVGEPAFSIALGGENNAFAPYVEENRVRGRVEVPFKGYVVAPVARLLFGADLKPIGYAVVRFSGSPSMAALGGFKSYSILLPGPRLAELTERARSGK